MTGLEEAVSHPLAVWLSGLQSLPRHLLGCHTESLGSHVQVTPTWPGRALGGDSGVETGQPLLLHACKAADTWQGLNQPRSQGASDLRVGLPAWKDMLGRQGLEEKLYIAGSPFLDC